MIQVYEFSDNWDIISSNKLTDLTILNIKETHLESFKLLDSFIAKNILNSNISIFIEEFNYKNDSIKIDKIGENLVLNKKGKSTYSFKHKFTISRIILENRNKKIEDILKN
jgi:hypothetical protein